MEPVYTQNYEIKDNMVDCFGNLRPGQILFIAQDMGTRHCQELSLSYDVGRDPAPGADHAAS